MVQSTRSFAGLLLGWHILVSGEVWNISTGVVPSPAGMARYWRARHTARARYRAAIALACLIADQGIPTEQVHALDTALNGTGGGHEIVMYLARHIAN
ncbi:MAG: hypothetical protein U0074_10805 [Kouleothrix sp.]